MKVLVAKLVWPAYFVGLIYLVYLGVDQYRHASSILNDHTVIEAPMELVDTSSRTKRGHTSRTYVFNYTYDVDGKNYSAEYSAVNEKGERYLDDPFLTIAHSNTDPTKVGALHVLEGKSSVGRYVRGFLFFAVVLGLFAMFLFGWSLPDDEDEEEANIPEADKT